MRFHSERGHEQRGPVWMSPGEMAEPEVLLERFCDDYTITDCRFYLWQMISASIAAESHHVAAPAGDQLYFFENLMPVVEALYLITGREEGNYAPQGASPDMLFLLKLLESIIDAAYIIMETGAFEVGSTGEQLKDSLTGFFEYKPVKEWKKEIKEICTSAPAESMTGLTRGLPAKLLPLCHHLAKLMSTLERSHFKE